MRGVHVGRFVKPIRISLNDVQQNDKQINKKKMMMIQPFASTDVPILCVLRGTMISTQFTYPIFRHDHWNAESKFGKIQFNGHTQEKYIDLFFLNIICCTFSVCFWERKKKKCALPICWEKKFPLFSHTCPKNYSNEHNNRAITAAAATTVLQQQLTKTWCDKIWWAK